MKSVIDEASSIIVDGLEGLIEANLMFFQSFPLSSTLSLIASRDDLWLRGGTSEVYGLDDEEQYLFESEIDDEQAALKKLLSFSSPLNQSGFCYEIFSDRTVMTRLTNYGLSEKIFMTLVDFEDVVPGSVYTRPRQRFSCISTRADLALFYVGSHTKFDSLTIRQAGPLMISTVNATGADRRQLLSTYIGRLLVQAAEKTINLNRKPDKEAKREVVQSVESNILFAARKFKSPRRKS